MADKISFKKWNNTPDSTESDKVIETKYYDLGTSSNKVVLIKFIVNLIADATSIGWVIVHYRTDTKSSYSLLGSEAMDYSASDQGSAIDIIQSGLSFDNIPGIQFKITIISTNDVSINDFHFLYRKKRKYSVEETD